MKIISPKKKKMHIGNPTQRCFVDDALVVTAERLIVSRHWQALDTQKGPKQMPKCHPHIQPIQEVSALGQLSARLRLPLPFLVFLGVVALQEGNFRIKKGTNVITAGKKTLPGRKAITTTQLSLLMSLTTESRKADHGVVTGLGSVGLMVLPRKPCNKTQWNQIPE